METKSTWEKRLSQYGSSSILTNDDHFDVIVIGAGITGITSAYLLAKEGKRVCVVERDRLGGNETSHTTAHLTYVTDTRIHELVRRFGATTARLILQSGAEAIDLIENIVVKEGIDCDFRRVPGYLLPSLLKQSSDRNLVGDQRFANDSGFPAEIVPSVPFFGGRGVCFHNQAVFDPLKFIFHLISKIKELGGKVVDNTEIASFEKKKITLALNNLHIHANFLIVATHVPLKGYTPTVVAAFFQTKLAQYSSYAIGAYVPPGIFQHASFWDLEDPYHYLRVEPRGELDYAIFGGNDHKTGQVRGTRSHYESLQKKLLTIVPAAQLDAQWSGQVIESHDGLPYIGEISKGQFIATGFAGNGMTFGVLSAVLATDAAKKRQNQYRALYDPNRFSLFKGTFKYVKENFDFPYYLVRDRLSRHRGDRDNIREGEGKVVAVDGEKRALFHSRDGNLISLSAVCPHMGGIVHWNSAEQSWDCPCHGSRFHCTGEVMSGPAESGLEERR
jgi:glycine/D-amino acid oxidase-like deaminating enzyme/nitrite reductase/ring-hydroxylating ferredoxin subunit